jgi:hypothetical protein
MKIVFKEYDGIISVRAFGFKKYKYAFSFEERYYTSERFIEARDFPERKRSCITPFLIRLQKV